MAYENNTTTTITVDGQQIATVALACRYVAGPIDGPGLSDVWFTDVRSLNPPLSPGVHGATATIVYNADVPYVSDCTDPSGCSVPAGTINTFATTVLVT